MPPGCNKRTLFKSCILISSMLSYLRGDAVQRLPFCDPNISDGSNFNDLVIVSTLDGLLTAFSATGGEKAWDLQTESMLSSNIHHVELTSNGKWARLVPSLRGSLYRLTSDTLEPLPLHAEQLLSSSFKYSDDLVIAGSRETVWYGLEAASGRVLYQCGSKGCGNGEEKKGQADVGGEMLVLRYNAHTVRALEPRTGYEKWNFSVAEHQLSMPENVDCGQGLGSEKNEEQQKEELKVGLVLPDGLVCAYHQRAPNQMLWKHKLKAPVAAAWRLRGGSLRALDVLGAGVPRLQAPVPTPSAQPQLYIGMHNQQLYVQERTIGEDSSLAGLPSVGSTALSWKPRPARPALAPPTASLTPPLHGDTQLVEKESGAVALLALYEQGSNKEDNGYFLYSEESEKVCDKSNLTMDEIGGDGNFEHEDSPHHVHVHVYSLWFWWKEVLLIAISSALIMNLMIWPRLAAGRERSLTQTSIPHDKEYIYVERHIEQPPLKTSSEGGSESSLGYSSRYLADFTPLRCLGRGGFGVVFEAKNNIDDCSYAVKRITLPKRQSRRERVLREVRALAKLEHEHIVRYFNAWLEEPPLGWQEHNDKDWMQQIDGVSVAITSEDSHAKQWETSAAVTSPSPIQSENTNNNKDCVMVNLQRPAASWERELSLDECFNALHYDGYTNRSGHSKRLRSHSCSDSFSVVFNEDERNSTRRNVSTLHSNNDTSQLSNQSGDDSFIVFANSEDGCEGRDSTVDSQVTCHTTKEMTFNKQLENVKSYDSGSVPQSSAAHHKKKKGHRRHWSLDLCVKSGSGEGESGALRPRVTLSVGKMYLYIQMQLCRRDSLHDWLRHNRCYDLRQSQVTGLFSQIVSAVEYVHLAGLIHRDLKPSNIFFAPDGRIKVGDFGLVTAMSDCSTDSDSVEDMSDQARHTRHTYRVGTHLYMSPEQLRGAAYSYKVDIYSLGLILFELLQPFYTESERIRSLLKIREGQFPADFAQKFPQEHDLLQMMLSVSPGGRPTAQGVRARAPLCQPTDPAWHFSLPPRPNNTLTATA